MKSDEYEAKFVQEVCYLKNIKGFKPSLIRLVTGLRPEIIRAIYYRKRYQNTVIDPAYMVAFKQRYG